MKALVISRSIIEYLYRQELTIHHEGGNSVFVFPYIAQRFEGIEHCPLPASTLEKEMSTGVDGQVAMKDLDLVVAYVSSNPAPLRSVLRLPIEEKDLSQLASEQVVYVMGQGIVSSADLILPANHRTSALVVVPPADINGSQTMGNIVHSLCTTGKITSHKLLQRTK